MTTKILLLTSVFIFCSLANFNKALDAELSIFSARCVMIEVDESSAKLAVHDDPTSHHFPSNYE